MARLRSLQSKGGVALKSSEEDRLVADRSGIPEGKASATKSGEAAHATTPAVRKRRVKHPRFYYPGI